MRPPGSRLKSRRTLPLISTDQLLHPIPGDPVVAGPLRLGPAFDNDSSDDQLGPGHGAPPQMRCQLCPETGANYVVQPVTVVPTGELPSQRVRGEDSLTSVRLSCDRPSRRPGSSAQPCGQRKSASLHDEDGTARLDTALRQ